MLSTYYVVLKLQDLPDCSLQIPLNKGAPCDRMVAESRLLETIANTQKHGKKGKVELWEIDPDGKEKKIRDEDL